LRGYNWTVADLQVLFGGPPEQSVTPCACLRLEAEIGQPFPQGVAIDSEQARRAQLVAPGLGQCVSEQRPLKLGYRGIVKLAFREPGLTQPDVERL
jgi:hypothetical protein